MSLRSALGGLAFLIAACGDGTGPVPPVGDPIPAFTDIEAGSGFTCALDADGVAWCWGINAYGRLGAAAEGIALDAVVHTPMPVAGALRFSRISTGAEHMCGVTLGNVAYCWGADYRGTLGAGEIGGTNPSPVEVLGGVAFTDIAASRLHSCGIALDRTAYCWGENPAGNVGNGTRGSELVPVPVAAEVEFSAISARTGSAAGSTQNSCGIDVSGAAWCWGSNGSGAVGDGSDLGDVLVPSPVAGGYTFADLSASGGYVCGVTTAGELLCWGHGDRVPTPWGSERTWASVSVGSVHSCAISAASELYCWGSNEFGQLGLGGSSSVPATEPTQVIGTQSWRQVSVGVAHTCAIATDDSAWCWGHGGNGELGFGEVPPHALLYLEPSPRMVATHRPVE